MGILDIQRISFSACFGMIASTSESLLIWGSRKPESDNSTVRIFSIPRFNYGTQEYYEIVDCQEILWTEPLLTSRFSLDQLKKHVEDPKSSDISYIKKLPCHTQAVEKAVKIVTGASFAVCGEVRRDGVIRSKLETRTKMPKFERKPDCRLH